MGQQQFILVILGVLMVGFAIAFGVAQFGSHTVQTNLDGVTAQMLVVSSDAYQYKLRPATIGGGSKSYVGYQIQKKMLSDDHGNYSVLSTSATQCKIQGISSMNTNWLATCTVDDTGRTSFTFVGW